MKKITIFEGIDHTGKSTAVEMLKGFIYGTENELPKVIHVEGKDANDYDYYNGIIANFATAYDQNLIFDRAMIGELVYGPLYRKKSRINLYEIRSLFKKYENIVFEININYVKHEDLRKYSELLIERDGLMHGLSPQGAIRIAEVRWIEQCMFKNLIDAIKLMDLPNVIINEGEFIPGGKNE